MFNIYDKKYVYELRKQIHMPTPFFRKISTVHYGTQLSLNERI